MEVKESPIPGGDGEGGGGKTKKQGMFDQIGNVVRDAVGAVLPSKPKTKSEIKGVKRDKILITEESANKKTSQKNLQEASKIKSKQKPMPRSTSSRNLGESVHKKGLETEEKNKIKVGGEVKKLSLMKEFGRRKTESNLSFGGKLKTTNTMEARSNSGRSPELQ